MSVLSGPVEGCLPVSVGRVLVFDGVDDQTTNLQVAVDGGAVQGRRNLLLHHTFRVWNILEQGKFRQKYMYRHQFVKTHVRRVGSKRDMGLFLVFVLFHPRFHRKIHQSL